MRSWLQRGWPLWLAAALCLLWRGVYWYTDAAWFASLGYSDLYLRRWQASATLWLLGAGLSGLALALALRTSYRQPTPRWAEPDPEGPTVGAWAWRVLPFIALLVAAGMGWYLQRLWPQWLTYWAAVPEGQLDPVFGRDASFYMLRLPLLVTVQRTALLFVLVLWVVAYLRYVELPQFHDPEARIDLNAISPGGLAHLARLAALFVLLWGWGFWLGRFWLVCSSRGGVVAGVGATDTAVRLPVLAVLALASLAGAAWLLRVAGQPTAKRLFLGILAYALLVMLGGGLPSLYQRIIVAPNEVALERPYIARAIAASRHALGLEAAVTVRDVPAPSPAAPASAAAMAAATADLPLWSGRELSEHLVGTEALRTYYSFASIDLDRYELDGRVQPLAVMLRELQADRLDTAAKTWVNRSLVYTHGYGMVAARAAQNETRPLTGTPQRVLGGLPSRGAPELAVTRPQVYYGETPADYVVTGLREGGEPEFDYPAGDRNVYSAYAGTGGVRLGGWWSRLAWTLRLRSLNLLLSRSVGPDSRLHWRRPVVERLNALVPFLDLDSDPYPVLSEGRLVWLADGLTVSSRYPYGWAFPLHYARALNAEQPEQYSRLSCNYARGSVKIAVDAYDGTVTFQRIDPDCALAATWAAVFPRLFAPAPMSADLTAHWRYPADLFVLQSRAVARFHMTEPGVFYNAEDLWDIAHEEATVVQLDEADRASYGERHERMLPYYLPLALPGETERGFRLAVPFTPAASREARTSRDNLTAFLVADCDPATYGRLTLLQYPKGALVLGPLQVEALIHQDPAVAEQLTLWGQQGSQVVRGRLLVLPVEDDLLYVEPLFLTAERRGALPELQRVIVVHRDRVAMAPTIEAALSRVRATGDDPAAGGGLAERRLRIAREALAAGEEARARGDLAAYGRALDTLRRALNEPTAPVAGGLLEEMP